MKKMVVAFLVLNSLAAGNVVSRGSVPPSFFVHENGSQNSVIVVGERADASDIIEASRLATIIGEISNRRKEIPLVEEIRIQHENVKAGTCIVETPQELSSLWYFDGFGVYGNGNGYFDAWETHEEIQLYIEDFLSLDPLLRVYEGDGYLDFSTILRIDNVRSPPHLQVEGYTQSARGENVTDLHNEQRQWFLIVDPYFVSHTYLPEVQLFNKVYTVLYIDSGRLITGTPHFEYVYLYEDSPFTAGEFTISLKDVDADHNKVRLEVTGARARSDFWMVLDPEHGFSTALQKKGNREVITMDIDNDGVAEYVNKEITGNSELDVWGYSRSSGGADLVIDGIKTLIGEELGVCLGVYWVEDVQSWPEKTCCEPFVIYPQEYDLKIRPETVILTASRDAYVDEASAATNFGGLSFLSVRSFQNANSRSFVKFDLPVPPSKAKIRKATLQMTPLTTPGARSLEVSRVTSAWDESSITWGTQPAAILTGTQVNNVMEWDVTTDVQDFYSGTSNYGWRISDQSEDSPLCYEVLFGSKESAASPRLILELTYDCNYLSETIPHELNWISTYYDDVDNNGTDPVYEIDISLCEPMKTICDPLFFEGPNYYYFVDFSDTSFETGVDFTVYQTERVGTYTVEEARTVVWELVKLDTEITEKDSDFNWILIGGMDVNAWVQALVDQKIQPDDGDPPEWFMKEAGYKMYSDPFGYGNRILVVAGKTAKDTQKAIEMLIEDMKR